MEFGVMNLDTIRTAEAEAKRFLSRIAAAKAALVPSEHGDWQNNEDAKATAALKRASMDLTRALADLRRPS